MTADMEQLKKQIKELKKTNSYLLDRLDKAYNDKMMLRKESMKSKETVKDAVKEGANASL
jgi:predicted RNase H-like nuclease (RuvC/YqgF family)